MEKKVVQISVKKVIPTSNGCALFLGNDEKIFIIYVDQGIGTVIQKAANGVQFERPLTHDLMITLLHGMGAQVERIIINDVEGSTFYARLITSMKNELGHKIMEVDARPSDSIVLALMAQKPIYAASKVMDSVDDMSEILENILRQSQESD